MSPRRTAPALAALALIAAAIAVIASLLMPNPGTRASQPAHLSEAAHEAHTGGTGVSSTIDAGDDAAFLADLFDGATDYTPEQAFELTTIGHRICDLGQPRDGWLASLTAPGPHALTADEAGKVYDVAIAAYCPERYSA